MRILAVGLDCEFNESDKNFYLELLGHVAREAERVILLSIETGRGRGQPMPDGVEVRRLERPGAAAYEPGWTLLHRTRLLLGLLPEMRALVREHRIDIVHMLDNFGPGLRLVRAALRGVGITVPSIMFKSQRLYPTYARLSLGAADRVVAMNDDFRGRLRRAGIAPGRIEVIRWGVARGLTANGAGGGTPLTERAPHLLWSGHLQLQNDDDLRLAVEVARRTLDACPQPEATFVFKSPCYRPEYEGLAGPRLHVRHGREAFAEARDRATVFLSPIAPRDVVVAPPLTWIEMMARGIPVVTTPVDGSRELVQHRDTGFRCATADDLVAAVTRLLTDHGLWMRMSAQARAHVRRGFSVESAARRHLQMWRSLGVA